MFMLCYNYRTVLIIAYYWIVLVPVCAIKFHISAHLFHIFLCTSVIVFIFYALSFIDFGLSC